LEFFLPNQYCKTLVSLSMWFYLQKASIIFESRRPGATVTEQREVSHWTTLTTSPGSLYATPTSPLTNGASYRREVLEFCLSLALLVWQLPTQNVAGAR
jgi:hypothetical protein